MIYSGGLRYFRAKYLSAGGKSIAENQRRLSEDDIAAVSQSAWHHERFQIMEAAHWLKQEAELPAERRIQQVVIILKRAAAFL